MPWRSWLNAEIYDRFVRERSIYGWLNRELVALARVRSSRRVLDLACGTGATALACLRVMPARAELVGVDAAPEMVELAEAQVRDPRARFEVCAAAQVDRLPGRFDRVVCNAAFWQFPAPGPVLEALASRTESTGLLAFNVPAERLRGEEAPIHSFQVALQQEIRDVVGSGELVHEEVDADHLVELAAAAGFGLTERKRLEYEGDQEELMELMAIPAMIARATPGLSAQRRERLLARARARSDPKERVRVPWVFFVFARGAAG